MVIVRKEQSGTEIRVNSGEIIQVELPTLGSAGYGWHIENPGSESLEFVAEETRNDAEEGKVGVPVTDVWCFKAKKAGNAEIIMDYYRKWEGREKSSDHFLLRVIITQQDR